MEERNIALIGMGNIMFHDEGLGTYLAKYIEGNYTLPENLVVVDGGILGFSLMTYYQEYDKVIIVGTTSLQGESGSIVTCSGEEMMAQGSTKKTANEAELTMMLEICSFHEEMGEVELISMIPDDIVDVCNGLTKTVLNRMPELLQTTLEALEKEGIVLRKRAESVSMEEIIQRCANPMTQRMH
ncbi:MAG TPA: hydrogenase maturation protease [Sulfurovum sp.]|nr:hydrogenase maturation protease [Sulfurovum sp.]